MRSALLAGWYQGRGGRHDHSARSGGGGGFGGGGAAAAAAPVCHLASLPEVVMRRIVGLLRDPHPCHHRIDIKCYGWVAYPFALLYFTGSDFFNR